MKRWIRYLDALASSVEPSLSSGDLTARSRRRALWAVVLSGLASACAPPNHGSPEKAVRTYVAREQRVSETDFTASCYCGPVSHSALQCDCWAEVLGVTRRYACECPAGRGTLPWMPKPCDCSLPPPAVPPLPFDPFDGSGGDSGAMGSPHSP